MSLETEIKKLTESVEKLTEIMVNQNQPKIEIKEKISEEKLDNKEIEVPKEKPKSKKKEKITLQMVKDLTKEKMASGIERNKLKDIISNIKEGASLPDLDSSELEECYNQMNKLTSEDL